MGFSQQLRALTLSWLLKQPRALKYYYPGPFVLGCVTMCILICCAVRRRRSRPRRSWPCHSICSNRRRRHRTLGLSKCRNYGWIQRKEDIINLRRRIDDQQSRCQDSRYWQQRPSFANGLSILSQKLLATQKYTTHIKKY